MERFLPLYITALVGALIGLVGSLIDKTDFRKLRTCDWRGETHNGRIHVPHCVALFVHNLCCCAIAVAVSRALRVLVSLT
ncbi:hypothetical protein BC830DRAFT_1143251 [Chytriomyces sp. MP71]|nr:hypothetical protein BC830DRAFT_1143251 [Chytriomyces sp. MP71]